MKLFLTALWIAIKHSGQRLLCLICALAVCLGLLAVGLSAMPAQSPTVARVAVRCLDDHPLIPMALGAVAQSGELSEIFVVELLEDLAADTSDYTAVVTLPQGFVASILNGQNLSPVVELRLSSPLEAAFVRQLSEAAARTLTTAQLGVYTVQEAMDYGRGLPQQRYQLLLANINLVFVRAFAQRLELLDSQLLSATGGLTLPLYYLSGLLSLLLLAYGFLYQPAVGSLRRFARGCSPGQRGLLWAASAGHIWLLTLVLTVPLVVLALAWEQSIAPTLVAWGLLALLATAWSLLLAVLLPRPSACGAGCLLLATGLGLCSGCLLPLALMPAAFAPLAQLLPSYYARELTGVLLGDQLPPGLAITAAVLGLVLLTASALLWRQDSHRREGRP